MSTDIFSTFDGMLHEVARLQVGASSQRVLPHRGDVVEGKYRIEEKLGQGGMGAVFRATHVESGKPVALKWLLARSSQSTARLVREAQAAAQIDHPNVVNVFDVGTHEDGRFLVMELLRGESLRDRFRRERLSGDELVRIMIPVLRGLHAAHAAGVIHRDLKPDNVFLCVGPDGTPREPKILDFGISKLRRRAEGEEHLTEEGTRLGTRLYMSPEQRADAPNVDERADLYAAGVLMYEALSGDLPSDDSDRAAPHALARDGIDVPPELEAIILRALSPRVEARHESAQALLRDLERWARGALERAEAVEVRSIPHPPPGLRHGLVRAMVMFAAFVVGALWALERTASDPPPPRVERELLPQQGPARASSSAVSSKRKAPEKPAKPPDSRLAVFESVPNAELPHCVSEPAPPRPRAERELSPHPSGPNAELPRDVSEPAPPPSEEAPVALPAPSKIPPSKPRPVESRAGPIRRTEL